MTVFGAEDAGDAVSVQFADLGRHNHAATAAKHLNVRAAPRFEQVDHVLEVLDVTALVGADGDALCVFLERCGDHFLHTAVAPKMNHLRTHADDDTSHDVDGGIVPVKQAGRRHKTYFVGRAVVGEGFVVCGQVGDDGVSRLTLTYTSTVGFLTIKAKKGRRNVLFTKV